MGQGESFEAQVAQWKQEEAAPFSGFDFSYLDGRLHDEEPPWSYLDRVRALMQGAQSALDIGTGGGEKLALCKDLFPPLTVATEGQLPNVAIAHARLTPLGAQVVASRDALDADLPFADNTFDLVINRHAAFNLADIERILRPGGTFITQQVDGRNLADLAANFGQTNPWSFFTLAYVLEQVAQTGLVVEAADEWTGKSYFTDVGALVYYLKAVPWVVEEFSVARDLPQLKRLHQRLAQSHELSFSRCLFMLQVRKP